MEQAVHGTGIGTGSGIGRHLKIWRRKGTELAKDRQKE
jgi:hypothetical protein